MLESRQRLEREITGMLAALVELAGGRYACLVGEKGVVLESGPPEAPETWALRRLLEERAPALLKVPEALASGQPLDDVFEGWEHDELFVAVVNGRVAVVVACPDAEPLRERARRPLKALADRMFRYQPAWRMDARGRGFFFGRAKLDLVVVGRPG